MNLVKDILNDAQQRLAVISLGTSIRDIATFLTHPKTPLVIVCDSDGVALGVVSGSDVVHALSRDGGEAMNANAAALMTQPIHSCTEVQTLESLWSSITADSHRCIPVLDDAGRPRGLVLARDVARALLNEVTNEEALLRDYVLGIGYQ